MSDDSEWHKAAEWDAFVDANQGFHKSLLNLVQRAASHARNGSHALVSRFTNGMFNVVFQVVFKDDVAEFTRTIRTYRPSVSKRKSTRPSRQCVTSNPNFPHFPFRKYMHSRATHPPASSKPHMFSWRQCKAWNSAAFLPVTSALFIGSWPQPLGN